MHYFCSENRFGILHALQDTGARHHGGRQDRLCTERSRRGDASKKSPRPTWCLAWVFLRSLVEPGNLDHSIQLQIDLFKRVVTCNCLSQCLCLSCLCLRIQTGLSLDDQLSSRTALAHQVAQTCAVFQSQKALVNMLLCQSIERQIFPYKTRELNRGFISRNVRLSSTKPTLTSFRDSLKGHEVAKWNR